MGRIIVQTEVTNPFDGDKPFRCGRLVDTGAGALSPPGHGRSRGARAALYATAGDGPAGAATVLAVDPERGPS